MKYIIYLRKSRAEENETIEEVLGRHENILQDFALKTFGEKIPDNCIYREIVSGETIQDRPVMQKILSLIQTENITGVLVTDPQRLSRGDLSDCGTVIRAFRYTDTLIVTPSKIYSLSDKFDRKFFETELTRGNDYLEYVKEIMLRGRLASVSEGNFIGSVAPYGYEKTFIEKKPALAVNQQEAETVRLIFDLYTNQQLGADAIATRLNELGISPRKNPYWTGSTIRDIVRNPVYIGKIRWNWRKTVRKYEKGEIITCRPKSDSQTWIVVQGRHEPIINEEMFAKAQERHIKNPRLHKTEKLVNPFAGVLKCECGKTMVYQPQRKGIQPRIHCPCQQHCGNKSAVFSDVEEAVISSLKSIAEELKTKSADNQNDCFSDTDKTAERISRELKTVTNQLDRLYDLLEQGIYTGEIFIQRKQKLDEKRQSLQTALENIQKSATTKINREEKILAISEIVELLQNPDAEPYEKNKFLKNTVKEIRYTRHTDNHTKWDKSSFSLEIFLNV